VACARKGISMRITEIGCDESGRSSIQRQVELERMVAVEVERGRSGDGASIDDSESAVGFSCCGGA